MARILQFEAFAIFAGTVDPNGNETPTSRGDLYLRTDAGQVRFFQNTDGTNTGWAEVALQGGDALTAITINLVDNTAPALTVQTSGFDNMVRISTTNGSESISIGEGLITGLASAVADYAVETLTPTFILRSDHAGGNAEDPFTLPPRTGGWRLVDAYIRSTGGTAGTMTLLDATGGNAMTNAMVPGNANVVTRATSLVTAQEDVASGATPVWSGASTPPATTCYSIWVGL